ncbi:hypothetical protein AGMMS49991_10170 [Spirochaetia bacterium]|nr:hypothetical protein AGMMS49991_10170 [Spirochaetia bacterium]
MKKLIGGILGIVCFSILMASCDITVDLDYAAFVAHNGTYGKQHNRRIINITLIIGIMGILFLFIP